MSETAQTGISQKNNQNEGNRSPITELPADGLFGTPGSDAGANAVQQLPAPANPVLVVGFSSSCQEGELEGTESIAGDAVPPRARPAIVSVCLQVVLSRDFLQPSAELSRQAEFVLLIIYIIIYIYIQKGNIPLG